MQRVPVRSDQTATSVGVIPNPIQLTVSNLIQCETTQLNNQPHLQQPHRYPTNQTLYIEINLNYPHFKRVPTISAGQWPQTCAFYRAVSWTGLNVFTSTYLQRNTFELLLRFASSRPAKWRSHSGVGCTLPTFRRIAKPSKRRKIFTSRLDSNHWHVHLAVTKTQSMECR
jgi:hypothetical protein